MTEQVRRFSLMRRCGALVLLLLAGCPDGKHTGPAEVCSKAYEQCRLPTGALGVCDTVTCGADQIPPCLVCRSQH